MRYLRPSFLRRMSRKTRKLNQRLVTISPLKKLLINRLKNQQVKRMTNTEQIKRMSLNSTVAMINPRPWQSRLSVARLHVLLLLQRHEVVGRRHRVIVHRDATRRRDRRADIGSHDVEPLVALPDMDRIP